MHVAIVGAGPAGAMAAIELARGGASVTLLDPSHPREKPCGGGLTTRAILLAAEVVPLASLPAVAVTRARIEAAAAAATVEFREPGKDGHATLLVLSRRVFDGALLGAAVAAGARLVPERVIDVVVGIRSVTVRTRQRSYHADVLIGADGATSLVRRRVGKPFCRDQLSIGAGFFVHHLTAPEITISCVAQQPGYLWSFPRPDHLAVGVCAQASATAGSRGLRAQTRAWIGANRMQPRRLEAYAWPIPSLRARDFDRAPVAGPRWMLVGDAAGLVDPLTREGIYYALLSGKWAAEALLAGASAPVLNYRERLQEEIYPELRRAFALSGGFFQPGFSRLLVEALRTSAPIREVFADLVRGVQPYRGLRRRLLRTHEWGLAAKVFGLALMRPKTVTSAASNGGTINSGLE